MSLHPNVKQDWKALHPNVKRFFLTCKSCSRNCESKIGKRFFKVRILLRRLEEQDCKYFCNTAVAGSLLLTDVREKDCKLAFAYTKAKFHHLLFFTLILGPFLPEFLGS
jgi:hypothetical protein